MHVHTTNDAWAYGELESDSNATKVIDTIKRHLAFNVRRETSLEIKYTQDKHSQWRTLAKHFKIKLDEIIKKENNIMIERFSKQTMHSKNVCKVRNQYTAQYEAIGIMPYHHLTIVDDMILGFIWDSREIQVMVPVTMVEEKHLTYNVIDSRNDLKLKENASTELKAFCEAHKLDIPVQFRY
jgi:hypothetical protein